MLKLLDVYSISQGTENAPDLLASLDVTANSEAERAAILQNARDLYGPDCACYWHDCGHDEGSPCAQVLAG